MLISHEWVEFSRKKTDVTASWNLQNLRGLRRNEQYHYIPPATVLCRRHTVLKQALTFHEERLRPLAPGKRKVNETRHRNKLVEGERKVTVRVIQIKPVIASVSKNVYYNRFLDRVLVMDFEQATDDFTQLSKLSTKLQTSMRYLKPFLPWPWHCFLIFVGLRTQDYWWRSVDVEN